MSSRRSADESTERGQRAHHRARFRVEPAADVGCSVVDSGPTGDVRQSIVDVDEHENRSCRAEVRDDTGDSHLLETTITGGCICPVFSSHDCLATVERVENGALIVSLSVRNREELTDIVSSLREVGASVHLLRIERSGGDYSGPERVHELAVPTFTNKQQEAVRIAVESGYYETPRETTLGTLADELDVSRSAVSQRLSAVESRLVERLFEAECDGVSAECAPVSAECDEVSAECDEVSAECDGVSTECDGVSTECDEVSAECDEVSAECDGVSTECDGVSTECDEVSTECDEVSAEGD